MMRKFYVRKFIAVGQDPNPGHPFGQGFNYWIEAGFNLSPEFSTKQATEALSEVLSRVDHRALGVDLKLEVPATSPWLAFWILRELERMDLGAQVLRLERGDGMTFEMLSEGSAKPKCC